MKRVLTEEYGWPSNFRREDWLRDREEVWQRESGELLDAGIEQ